MLELAHQAEQLNPGRHFDSVRYRIGVKLFSSPPAVKDETRHASEHGYSLTEDKINTILRGVSVSYLLAHFKPDYIQAVKVYVRSKRI